jgi:uncharacterized protein (TIGR03083 family)
MVDDSELTGLDPYDLMALEAARIDLYFSKLSDEDWRAPSRCAGWSVRDVLAHLTSSESYNRACLDGTVQQLLADWGEKGATDIASANEIGVRQFDGQPTSELLGMWRAECGRHIADFRARDGQSVDSSVGEYPARWQAFHLAFELATHADDVGVPVSEADATQRGDWEPRFGRFALVETKPELKARSHDANTHVRGEDIDIELPNEVFVQAVAARLPDDSGVAPDVAAKLSVTP